MSMKQVFLNGLFIAVKLNENISYIYIYIYIYIYVLFKTINYEIHSIHINFFVYFRSKPVDSVHLAQ